MRTLLCRLGIHRPLKFLKFLHVDMSTWEFVHLAKCPCGKRWLAYGLSEWFGPKVRTTNKE